MNILYFGNRDYWDLEKAGHTRYENIFKTLMNLNKHQVLYTRIYGWKHFIKNFIHYSKNICRIKIKFSKNTLFILEIKNNKLGILSIYTNNRENVLIDTISSLENLADFQQRNKWIWFNNYLLWDKIKNVRGYKYYFDSFEIFFDPSTGKEDRSYRVKDCYNDIAKNASLITSISNAGVSFFKSIRPNSQVFLIRNGVDLKIFKPEKILKKNSQKVVGLIGNLHNYHDYSGLVMAARELKNVSFIIVGKILKDKELIDKETENDLKELFSLTNVKHHTWIPINELPEIISTFDAGLITYKTKKHDIDTLLNTGDSLKKYQYLACNVPVITSDCQEIDSDLEDGIFTFYEQKEMKYVIEKVIYNEKKINYHNLVKKYDWNLILKEIFKYTTEN